VAEGSVDPQERGDLVNDWQRQIPRHSVGICVSEGVGVRGGP
jgi:hypothetical protein